MIHIKKIKCSDLKDFVESEQFQRFEEKPLSLHRAESYLSNPRAQQDDYVLYLLLNDDNLLAYRTVLPDLLFVEDKVHRIVWLSGVFVLPQERNKGYADMLLKEVCKDWDYKVLATNFAPEITSLLEKNDFVLYRSYQDKRMYRKLMLNRLIKGNNSKFKGIKALLAAIDVFVNFFLKAFDFNFLKSKKHCVYNYLNVVDKDIAQAILENENSFTRRNKEELEWILRYPWISSDKNFKEASDSYFFSHYKPVFRNVIVKCIDQNKQFNGFIWLVINKEKISMPYYDLKSPEAEKQIRKEFVKIVTRYGAKTITYSKDLGLSFFQRMSVPVLFTKEIERKYYIHKKFKTELPENTTEFQLGEGDLIFTSI